MEAANIPVDPPSSPPIRVLLIDSHQIVLWGLEKLIGGEFPRMEVAGLADNGADALKLARESRPDVVLLDLCLGKASSIQLIPGLLKTAGLHVIVFVGASHDRDAVDEAVFHGARGVVYKEQPTATILKAIQKVHEGELWLPRKTMGRVVTSFVQAEPAFADPVTERIVALTRKEGAIVAAFASEAGASNKRIAHTLGISEQTLRNHLTSIFGKLGIRNRFDLFMFAQLHHHRLDIAPVRSRPVHP